MFKKPPSEKWLRHMVSMEDGHNFIIGTPVEQEDLPVAKIVDDPSNNLYRVVAPKGYRFAKYLHEIVYFHDVKKYGDVDKAEAYAMARRDLDIYDIELCDDENCEWCS